MTSKFCNRLKLGIFNPHTWGAYMLNGEVFIKQAVGDAHASYPDFGCSFETFTNSEFLELETLSPLKKAAPGETVEQAERWSLHKNVRLAELTDAAIDAEISPLLDTAKAD